MDDKKVLLFHPTCVAQIISLKNVDGAKRSLISYKRNKEQEKWKYLTTLTLDDGTFVIMFTCVQQQPTNTKFNDIATRIYTQPFTKLDKKKYSLIYQWFDSDRKKFQSEKDFNEVKQYCLYNEILFIRVDEDIDILSISSEHFEEILDKDYIKNGISYFKRIEYRYTNETVEEISKEKESFTIIEPEMKIKTQRLNKECLEVAQTEFLELPILSITSEIPIYKERKILVVAPEYYFSFNDHEDLFASQKYSHTLDIILPDGSYLSIFHDLKAMENNYFVNQIGTRLITDPRINDNDNATNKLREYLANSKKECDYEILKRQVYGFMYIIRKNSVQNYLEITDEILTFLFDTDWCYNALRKSDKYFIWY